MDIKEYIKEVVTQISEATLEINGREPDFPLTVNPSATTLRDINGRRYIFQNLGRYGSDPGTQIVDIEFDIAVTATEKSEAGGKIGISVAGFGGAKGQENTVVNHVKFSLPVAFPSNTIKNH